MRSPGRAEIVVDSRVSVALGERLLLGSHLFHVVGTVNGRTLFGGQPMVYTNITDAQAVAFGGQRFVTAVVTIGKPARLPPGRTSHSPGQVIGATLDEMNGAVSSIEAATLLMWLVAASVDCRTALRGGARETAGLRRLEGARLVLRVALWKFGVGISRRHSDRCCGGGNVE